MKTKEGKKAIFLFQIVACCLLAVAVAAPQNYYQGQYPQQYQQPQYQQQYSGKAQIPIVSETNEINPDGSFSYRLVEC